MTMQPRVRYHARLRVRTGLAAALAFAAVLAVLGCEGRTGGEGSPTAEEGRSPFATGNVSVAPQVEGRAAVPTPVPPPLPPEQTPTAQP